MNDKMKELLVQFELEQQQKASMVAELLKEELLDEDGYPTRAAHTIVETWPIRDAAGWFKFIHGVWAYASWGWHEKEVDHQFREGEKVRQYNISTAGWSGNEGLIRSMQTHDMLWHTTWVQSRRGGHYIFEVELDSEPVQTTQITKVTITE